MAGSPCFWLCVFRYPLVLRSSYFLVLRRGIFPFVGSPRIDWTSNSCFFPLLRFTKKRKLLLFLTKYPHQQQHKCFCLATATNEEKAKKYERAFVGNLVKLDVAANYSPGAAKTTILLRANIFSFYCKRSKTCCLSLYIQNKIPNLPQLPTIQNLHQQESSSLCLLREEWSGLATKFCLLVIYSRPGGFNHKHSVNFWLQIFLSLPSRVQINLGRSQKLSVFWRCFQSFKYFYSKLASAIAELIQRQLGVQTLKTKCWLL